MMKLKFVRVYDGALGRMVLEASRVTPLAFYAARPIRRRRSRRRK
jgi:hypothetical protein